MDRSTWETLVTALQSWEAINFNASDEHDRRLEERAMRNALGWLVSVEPKEDN